MFCSKPFSEEFKEDRPKVLPPSSLPAGLDLDTLYMFTWESEEDSSEPRKMYPAKDMHHCEIVQDSAFKGKFNFVVEFKEKVYICGVENREESVRWLAALEKGKKNFEEIAVTKFNRLEVNVDPIIKEYKEKTSKDCVHERAKKDAEMFFRNEDISEGTPAEFLLKALKAVENLKFVNPYITTDTGRPPSSTPNPQRPSKNLHTELPYGTNGHSLQSLAIKSH